MILKGFAISRGSTHAAHLMRTDENEHVQIQEIRGFVADDLAGAFKESQAIARGTKCKQHLFSCVFSPPESANLSTEQFMFAVDRAEHALGLGGQPRVVVFHEKEGRQHAHCVWSRIDAQTMKAKQLSHWKTKLGDVSRALHQEFAIEMPRGLENRRERDPLNFSQAEWQMAKRVGEDPRWLKETVQACWAKSDNRKSFEAALESRALFLAKGDKRGFVVVDFNGTAQPVSRLVGGNTKDVRAKLGSEPPERTVADVQKLIALRSTEAVRARVASCREGFKEREKVLKAARVGMTEIHRIERATLAEVHAQSWADGTRERQARFPRGVRGLWSWITGKSALIKTQNEAEATAQKERSERERFDLAERQRVERRALQAQIAAMRTKQAQRMLELRKDLGQFMRFARPSHDGPAKPTDRTRTRTRDRGHER